jgi:hypothetical protein
MGQKSGSEGWAKYGDLQSAKAKQFFRRAITDCGKGPCATNFANSGVE